MFKAVITIYQTAFPKEPVTFEHDARFASEAECKAALPVLRRDAEALLRDRFSFSIKVEAVQHG